MRRGLPAWVLSASAPSDAIADRDDARHRAGGTSAVTARGSSRSALVEMVQTANLREDLLLSVVVHSADIHDNTGSLHARPPDGNLHDYVTMSPAALECHITNVRKKR